MSLFGGMYGMAAHRAASSASEAASRSASRAERAALDVRMLEERLEKLTLVCQAMWSLVQERTELSEEDLAVRVREFDLADGVEDGKVTKTVAKCPQCGRVMHPRHKKCLYCGAVDLQAGTFDKI